VSLSKMLVVCEQVWVVVHLLSPSPCPTTSGTPKQSVFEDELLDQMLHSCKVNILTMAVESTHVRINSSAMTWRSAATNVTPRTAHQQQ
jgi:hypothetical protein